MLLCIYSIQFHNAFYLYNKIRDYLNLMLFKFKILVHSNFILYFHAHIFAHTFEKKA
jgi:hypothetical protein